MCSKGVVDLLAGVAIELDAVEADSLGHFEEAAGSEEANKDLAGDE